MEPILGPTIGDPWNFPWFMINGLIKLPLFYKSMAILRDFPKITMHEVSVGIIMTPAKVKANIHTHQKRIYPHPWIRMNHPQKMLPFQKPPMIWTNIRNNPPGVENRQVLTEASSLLLDEISGCRSDQVTFFEN